MSCLHFPHFPIEWDVADVKRWANDIFNEEIAKQFEQEEIDGRTLQSDIIVTETSMSSLGLTTIGKKEKFTNSLKKLFGT